MAIGFENLKVYQKALDFCDKVYKVTRDFPKEETFLLTNQLRRAAVSITLNITEGSGRTKKEYKHFLNMARTSAYECVAGFEIAKRQKYITSEKREEMYEQVVEIIKMLSALKNSL